MDKKKQKEINKSLESLNNMIKSYLKNEKK